MATISGQPNIDIIFTQKAVTAVNRSERGVLCLLVQDEHNEANTPTKFVYKFETDINDSDFTAENLRAIKRCFLTAVNKVYVLRGNENTTLKEFTDVMEKLKYNYVCTTVEKIQQELGNYVKTFNVKSKGKKVVAVVKDITTADSKYIINVKGDWVHDAINKTQVTMTEYLPRLASLLCNLPMNRSITYYTLTDIDDVDSSFIDGDNVTYDSLVDKGYLTIFVDDEDVKVGRGVNSLVSITSTDTEDMRKIIIVESMNLILEDLYTTFKDYYVGKYKNHLDNQRLFITSVNAYFRTLAGEEILDPEFDNRAKVDIETQRNAWLSIGKAEAEDWSDTKVEEMTFKSYVYLYANIKILDAIEDLKFTIECE